MLISKLFEGAHSVLDSDWCIVIGWWTVNNYAIWKWIIIVIEQPLHYNPLTDKTNAGLFSIALQKAMIYIKMLLPSATNQISEFCCLIMEAISLKKVIKGYSTQNIITGLCISFLNKHFSVRKKLAMLEKRQMVWLWCMEMPSLPTVNHMNLYHILWHLITPVIVTANWSLL